MLSTFRRCRPFRRTIFSASGSPFRLRSIKSTIRVNMVRGLTKRKVLPRFVLKSSSVTLRRIVVNLQILFKSTRPVLLVMMTLFWSTRRRFHRMELKPLSPLLFLTLSKKCIVMVLRRRRVY